MINADVKLFTFNKTSLDVNTFVFPALSQPGRVYTSTNASYHVKLIWNLSWNISFYGNWDIRPPGNLPASDYGTTSGLSWTFGPSLRTTPTTIQWPKSTWPVENSYVSIIGVALINRQFPFCSDSA